MSKKASEETTMVELLKEVEKVIQEQRDEMIKADYTLFQAQHTAQQEKQKINLLRKQHKHLKSLCISNESKPTINIVKIESQFRVGTIVCHPRWGIGKVLILESNCDKPKLTVQFQEHGKMHVTPEYSNGYEGAASGRLLFQI